MQEFKKKKIKEIELFVNEQLLGEDPVELISFVSNPAIELGFRIFTEDENKEYKFEIVDEEKHIVTGPIMLANKRIKRQDFENSDPYYVFFSEKTIEKAMEIFFKHSNHKKSNIEHMFGVDNVIFLESWKVEDPNMDKSKLLGYNNIPKGSWFGSAKINNPTFWQDIKEGKVIGFSIEGFWTSKEENKETSTIEKQYNQIVELFKNYNI